jgi:hypothetical protein
MDDKSREFAKQQKKEYQRAQKAKKQEGEVSIDYSPQNTSKNKPRSGVYVDYEEVKDWNFTGRKIPYPGCADNLKI